MCPRSAEAVARLMHLREHGPTAEAFTFGEAFSAPDAATAGAPILVQGQLPGVKPRFFATPGKFPRVAREESRERAGAAGRFPQEGSPASRASTGRNRWTRRCVTAGSTACAAASGPRATPSASRRAGAQRVELDQHPARQGAQGGAHDAAGLAAYERRSRRSIRDLRLRAARHARSSRPRRLKHVQGESRPHWSTSKRSRLRIARRRCTGSPRRANRKRA